MSVLSNLIASITSANGNTAVANIIGNHLVSSGNTSSSIKALLTLVTPANAASIAQQIAALPHVPATVSPLLTELAAAKDQATITAITLQIESALSASSSALGNILSSL